MTNHDSKNNKKRMNLIIILSTSGALLMFAIIGLLAYLPGKMSTTNNDFLYTSTYTTHGKYFVSDNKLQIESTPEYEFMEPYEETSAVLYRYDSATDTSSVVSDEDAKKLTVSSDVKSPDGYSVVVKYESTNYFPDPLGNSYDSRNDGYAVFLRKGISSRHINVEQIDYGGFQFVAWIIEE